MSPPPPRFSQWLLILSGCLQPGLCTSNVPEVLRYPGTCASVCQCHSPATAITLNDSTQQFKLEDVRRVLLPPMSRLRCQEYSYHPIPVSCGAGYTRKSRFTARKDTRYIPKRGSSCKSPRFMLFATKQSNLDPRTPLHSSRILVYAHTCAVPTLWTAMMWSDFQIITKVKRFSAHESTRGKRTLRSQMMKESAYLHRPSLSGTMIRRVRPSTRCARVADVWSVGDL